MTDYLENKMIVLTALIGLILNFATPAFAMDAFPIGPQPSLTPGSLCTTPDAYRYPEKIRYCNRNVESKLKDDIVKRYDATFGYRVGSIGRQNFKIDHYIPLCMGGSNAESNLWPQHPTVYAITDPIEPLLCNKMAKGELSQAEAIRLIKLVKNDLSQASKLLQSLQAI
jgi:hypothetical protein